MFNTYDFNTSPFNDLAFPFAVAAVQDDIVFNGYSLQDAVAITSNQTWDNMPNRDFNTFPIPREDGEGIRGDFWRRKTIVVEGTLRKSSQSEFNDEIDAFKKAMAKREGILDIKINGIIRRFIVTLTNTNDIFGLRRNFNLTFIRYRLQFTCLTPFGEDVDGTVFQALDTITNPFETIIDNEGTIKTFPIYYLSFFTINDSNNQDQAQTTFTGVEKVFSGRVQGQTFLPTKDTITSIEVTLNKQGAGSGDLTMSLYKWDTDYATTIAGGAIATKTLLDGFHIGTQFYEFDFGRVEITANDLYFFELSATGGDSSNNYGLARSPTDTYSDGTLFTNGVGIATKDATFITHFDRNQNITKVEILNDTNDEKISITQNPSSGDILAVDTIEKEVLINNVEKDYDGIFPSFDININDLFFTITADSVRYDLNIQYKKRYL